MISHSPLNRQSPRPPNSRSQMHSPAPMPPNGGYGGMQMNPNQYGPPSGGNGGPPMMQGGPPPQGMRGPPQGMNPEDMGPGGGWNPQMQQNMMQHGGPPGQNQHGMQNGPPGGMMNPHANMMSPRPPSGPGPGQGQVMSSPHHGPSQGKISLVLF